MTHLSFVVARAGQAAEEEREECGEDFSERPGRVGHDHLPHVKGSLSDGQRSVRAAHVQTSEHPVTSVNTQNFQDGLKEIRQLVRTSRVDNFDIDICYRIECQYQSLGLNKQKILISCEALVKCVINATCHRLSPF